MEGLISAVAVAVLGAVGWIFKVRYQKKNKLRENNKKQQKESAEIIYNNFASMTRMVLERDYSEREYLNCKVEINFRKNFIDKKYWFLIEKLEELLSKYQKDIEIADNYINDDLAKNF